SRSRALAQVHLGGQLIVLRMAGPRGVEWGSLIGPGGRGLRLNGLAMARVSRGERPSEPRGRVLRRLRPTVKYAVPQNRDCGGFAALAKGIQARPRLSQSRHLRTLRQLSGEACCLARNRMISSSERYDWSLARRDSECVQTWDEAVGSRSGGALHP